MDSLEEQPAPPAGKFVETYKGSSEAFPGRKSFMNAFRDDQYAGERQNNLYFPFASQEEWQFASWLLCSRLSLTAIDSLLVLDILQGIPISFRTRKQLRSRAEALPPGPAWLCEEVKPEAPTKHPVHLFYRQPLECLQALLSNPVLTPHISFMPRKVWTSAARICCIYDEWLTGERAWNAQDALPPSATILGVVLSSDKTNISIMTGNRMAHPILISLANIDTGFIEKTTHICSLLQDWLFHQVLNWVLTPLKTAATVGIMMNDPVGNLRYCYTLLASWIADTPEECLLAATSPKASPVTTATSKDFGNPFRHPSRTSSLTLSAIQTACTEQDPFDYENFLKVIKHLHLNGVIKPCWKGWPLSDPPQFLTPKPLHHFHRMFWDHDVKWCIAVTGSAELDFRFSLLQTPVGYCTFEDGISQLKQVTGHDHHAVQCYIIALEFTDDTLVRVANALQGFHNHKDTIMCAGAQKDSWEIPKLELLQSVVSSIHLSGAVIQWSADPTEHAHVQEIKVLARAGNNQDYYRSQGRHTTIDAIEDDEIFEQAEVEHEPDEDDTSLADHLVVVRSPINYFAIADMLVHGCIPNTLKPYCTLSTTTTAFHLSTKPSLRLSVDEAAAMFNLLDLRAALSEYLYRLQSGMPHLVSGARSRQDHELPFDRLQVWYKIHAQQMHYYATQTPDAPQTMHAMPPSPLYPHGLYDAAIINADPDSNWP
ncbi:hypothetical protein PISMIDRAFT_14270 [Pisolithus microcarpus 441]|uniref:Unplaced genomic scaffold scaffold_118, whole genome shotgun sequence n=1 Tax=Pisolithus microcarpus 441 TaxID=765257 RepID=A0A0C9Y1K4_9AGAM|nr:hypothetical protein PISMIDRAFT_14270 [Pisolithus microcarpus 441]